MSHALSAGLSREAGRDRGRRTLLVGDAETVAQLRHMLTVVQPAPVVVGCLVAGAGGEADGEDMRVLGGLDAFDSAMRGGEVEQVLISLPASRASEARPVLEQVRASGVAWRWIPTLADQLAGVLPSPFVDRDEDGGGGRARQVGEVDPVALLGRGPRELDEGAIRERIRDRVVMITGAGGSIGSELARIVCRFEPRKVCLVERAENALFEIDRQVGASWPELSRAACLHDVTDAGRTIWLLERHRPDIILHAAAHKHVPMMEEHPADAIENNLFGTGSIADAAVRCGAERFVMISTDKAVNPSSVMGASKRLAELYVQHLNETSATVFSMVRFGNVLGSACSVLPIWSRQLAEGGPLTVTDERMTRYFMTIPEAAGLVLQSMALAGEVDEAVRGGEVFLLDMGEPVRIADLAEQFIKAHGLAPGRDVEVRITGVRPGEKLHEELVYADEDVVATSHEAVRVLRATPPSAEQVQAMVARFGELRNGGGGYPWEGVGREELMAAIRASIPEMCGG